MRMRTAERFPITARKLTVSIVLLFFPDTIHSFGFKLPSLFTPFAPTAVGSDTAANTATIQKTSQKLLVAISNTANGKNASPEKQIEVLGIVSELESLNPPSDDLLTDSKLARELDGVWYLQFTCPSNVDGAVVKEYKPENPSENDQVTTRQVKAQGTIAATSLTFDTSKKVVEQIFDTSRGKVTNRIDLGWGTLSVTGAFRPSDAGIPRRAVVGFEELRIALTFLGGGENVPTWNGDWVFSLLQRLTKKEVGGWLETTFISDEIRIGRGNKGTCFVLTRDYDAVVP